MKKIILPFIFILILSGSAFAATPSLSGGSGLLVMKTADLTEKGGHSISLFAGEERFLNANTKSYDTIISPGYLFSVTDTIEFGVTATYLFDDSTESRLSGAVGTGKYRVAGNGEDGFALAISAYGSLYTREDEGDAFSSGEGTYGGEIHLSHFGRITNLHLSAGGGRGDVKVFSPDEGFISDKVVTVNAGVELKALPELTISLEMLGSRYQDLERDNLIIMPSVKYTSGGQLTFMCGIGYGVRTTKSQPESRILAGFSYGLNPPKKITPHVSARINRLASETKTLREEVDALKEGAGTAGSSNTLDTLRREISSLVNKQAILQEEISRLTGKQPAKPLSKDARPDRASLRVEIFNASAIPGLAMKVANILKKKGYNVIRIKALKGSREAKTVIWHRKEVMYLAVDLGHKIPATQWVKPGIGLPDNIDVRIIVGRDLKFLKK